MSISSEIVTGTITLSDRAPLAANFGIPAVFCNAPFIGGRLYELSPEGLAEMVTDGFVVTDRGYSIVSSMASQNPHTDQVLVYNRAANNSQAIDLTPTVTTAGFEYAFTVQVGTTEHDISVVVQSGDVAADICDDLVAAIDPLSGVAAADNTTKVTLTPSTAGTHVYVKGAPSALTVKDTSSDAGIATDLAAAALVHEFYAFVIDSFAETEANAAATWAEANEKLFIHQSADSTDVADSGGTGVGADFLASAYHRSAVLWTADMAGNAAAGLFARQLSQDPGTSSYAFKDITGADADALTTTRLANGKGKNLLLFGLSNGARHTFFGKAASGRSLRITSAIDFINARIREAGLAVFLNAEYVPYSARGFAQMEAAVRGVLSLVESRGIIDPGWTVTVPDAATQSTANKNAGLLDAVRFNCVLPGDVLKVIYRGSVTL
jgi:uncharacterized protein DUF3383